MRLNHLNICTSDVPAAAEFFVEYFGFRRRPSRAPETLALVHDESGFTLIFSNFDRQNKPVYPKGFHFGFIVETRAEVDRLFARLQAVGAATKAPAEAHGSYTFYFNAPGEVLMEIQCVGSA